MFTLIFLVLSVQIAVRVAHNKCLIHCKRTLFECSPDLNPIQPEPAAFLLLIICIELISRSFLILSERPRATTPVRARNNIYNYCVCLQTTMQRETLLS
jgi:hypothetical protein